MLMNMKELLAVAKEHNFAVPAFNISDYNMFNGIMEASEEKNAPVIIAIHPDELRHISSEMVKGIVERIHNSSVPAVIHLDHGGTFAQAVIAIRAGFTSVMIDASCLPYERNVAICKKVCEMAHAINVSVEGELGTIGNTDSVETTSPDEILYTDPAQAKDFIAQTGIDCLAIAIGTCHGIYPKDKKPELRIDVLDAIKKIVDVPLVLHGGSSNKDSEIAKSVEHGVNKINISSDTKAAYYEKMREVLKNAALREPNMIQPPCLAAMKEVAYHKIDLFQAGGKASLY
ncbi:MAG: ketose-bisphosphate aldolase [Oscillospiraceae bacterium]|nr:ketose-bisphosphate aldolase [Oscillospiraceae bacterium]